MRRFVAYCCVFLAAGACLLTGCLLNHSNHAVIRQGEPLRHVVFETTESKRIFESFVQRRIEDDSNSSSASFGIPFLVGFERTKTTSESAIRNDAVSQFDSNGDGIISEFEVTARE